MKLRQTFGLTGMSEMNKKQAHIGPPRWSLPLLRLFIRKEYLEEIEGDLQEVYEDFLSRHSGRKANWLFYKEVIKLIRPNLIKKLSDGWTNNNLSMFRHNLLISIRGFKRHKSTFLINLVGLTTGLTAALLIFLWISDERSVDAFHEKDDQLYWVMNNFQLPEAVVTWDYTSGKTGRFMKADFPEVEESVWIGNSYFRPDGILSFEENSYETHGIFASKNFFEVLTYELRNGNASEVLKDDQSIVLSERLAEKIFGSAEAAIGEMVSFEDRLVNQDFIVSGVFKAPPANATRQFEMVINYNQLIKADKWADEWNGGYAETYLVLKKGTDIEAFNEKISNYLDEKMNHERFTVFVQKYSDYYLRGDYENGVLVGGRIESVRLFTVVAILILLIACINFMNLSTAQASKKMKEIGVKKAIGARRASLASQFITESIVITLMSFLLAVALTYLLIPQLNAVSGKNIDLDFSEQLPFLLSVAIVVGLLTGSYPAFYLSGFKPIEVLKGKLTNIKGEDLVRQSLVVVQFTLSIIFIIGIIVINKQIEYTQSKPLGYDRRNIVTFQSKGLEEEQFITFLTALKNIPGVVSTGNMAGDFLWGEDSGSGYWWGTDETNRNHLFKSPKMGVNSIETLGLKLLEGRTFSQELNDGNDQIIVNEAAAKMMGLENPAGKFIKYGDDKRKEIIGMVQDFQYGSLHQKVEPMIIRYRYLGRECIVKLQTGAEVNTLDKIEALYAQFHPRYHFDVSYLEDDYMALYQSEEKESVLSNFMAIVAIIISCLGLFGLAAFTAERRIKEIGIRKILGASRLVIVRLLTGSFTKTVIISIIIALPIGYFLADSWLQNFAYTVDLSWWYFAVAGGMALLIAWLTVGFQTVKAATVNPVDCLKNE
jgi:ABC-type antimicrobial peptide transport system permease subunit